MAESKKERREMKLRCVMKKASKGCEAICLELSLVAKGSTPEVCKANLEQLIEDYLETLGELHQEGEAVFIRPVNFYFFKKLLFDSWMFIEELWPRKSVSRRGFVQRRVVPIGF